MSERTPDHHPCPAVTRSADYTGNWSELQLRRSSTADFIRRCYNLQALQEHEDDRQPYRQFARSHQNRLADVGRLVEYVDADERLRRTLGRSSLGAPPRLYRNALHDGQPLTLRQKDIIAAHETYHASLDVSGEAIRSLVWTAFDFDRLSDKQQVFHLGYLSRSEEIMARMAQLKNYFGMAGSEAFTADHLDHARHQYVADTQLDNRMTMFFRMIDTDPARFIGLMNSLPV